MFMTTTNYNPIHLTEAEVWVRIAVVVASDGTKTVDGAIRWADTIAAAYKLRFEQED